MVFRGLLAALIALLLSAQAYAHGRPRTLMTCLALGRSNRAPIYTLIERPSLTRGFEMEFVLMKSAKNPLAPEEEFPLIMTGLTIYSGNDGVVVKIQRKQKGQGLIYLDYRRRVSQFVLQGLHVIGDMGIEIWDTTGYEYTCSQGSN